MFPAWRLQLREARVAWQSGRYDEASALLTADSLREFLPAKQLAKDVAGKFVERAGDRFARGDSVGRLARFARPPIGSVEQAEAIARLRHQYADSVISEVRHYLAAGQAGARHCSTG